MLTDERNRFRFRDVGVKFHCHRIVTVVKYTSSLHTCTLSWHQLINHYVSKMPDFPWLHSFAFYKWSIKNDRLFACVGHLFCSSAFLIIKKFLFLAVCFAMSWRKIEIKFNKRRAVSNKYLHVSNYATS